MLPRKHKKATLQRIRKAGADSTLKLRTQCNCITASPKPFSNYCGRPHRLQLRWSLAEAELLSPAGDPVCPRAWSRWVSRKGGGLFGITMGKCGVRGACCCRVYGLGPADMCLSATNGPISPALRRSLSFAAVLLPVVVGLPVPKNHAQSATCLCRRTIGAMSGSERRSAAGSAGSTA